MTRLLITAFEPYDCWQANSSWLAMVELTKDLPQPPEVTTRLYPVDFAAAQEKLAEDLAEEYDIALHLGQAPGSTQIHLEAIGLNIGGLSNQRPETYQPLTQDGPVAYRSMLPLADWAKKIRACGIPCQVSYHAGTYLCNAMLYLSHYIIEQKNLKTKAAFIHIPLDTSQIIGQQRDIASLQSSLAANALRVILQEANGEEWA